MYIVALSGQKWYDTVSWINDSSYKAGDLLQDAQWIYVCLGVDIAFSHLYNPQKKQPYGIFQAEKICTNFISANTLTCIHWMVQQYFSSYKHVCSLFVPDGIEKKLPSKQQISKTLIEQSCILFPDLWTLSQTYPLNHELPNTAILHGWMTSLQKRKLFWLIRSWEVHTLLATNRGLFFSWHNLKNITIYQATKRAYSAQADPRFVLQETAKKIAEVYGAKIQYTS